ncbi:hypothetical protein M422DRAFT_57700 [Sphaerobolus stellatus SS14]|nr:hypothetical protein M422DRAFT_57700 [Sphaerobolus stellatus SS14]
MTAPVSVGKRANPCFVTGNVTLPAEVADGLPALEKVITCSNAVRVVSGAPDVTSGGISFSSVDFSKFSKSPVGFALSKFTTPTDPAKVNLALLQNQLNIYLAVEAGLRSQPNSIAAVAKVKDPKFFLQFQIARVKTAQGQTLSVQDSVQHQLEKVLNNAVGASAAEKAQVNALATQI